MASKQHVHDVVVIGGGVAGLSAAQELIRNGFDNVCVVEAQNRLGGRLKQVSGIVPWDLDAGAELVHGQDSTVASILAKDLKADLAKKEYPNYVYWRDSGDIVCACGEASASEDATVGSTFNLIDQVRCVSLASCNQVNLPWRPAVVRRSLQSGLSVRRLPMASRSALPIPRAVRIHVSVTSVLVKPAKTRTPVSLIDVHFCGSCAAQVQR